MECLKHKLQFQKETETFYFILIFHSKWSLTNGKKDNYYYCVFINYIDINLLFPYCALSLLIAFYWCFHAYQVHTILHNYFQD